jgi:phosphatidylglycerol lysyltransferase
MLNAAAGRLRWIGPLAALCIFILVAYVLHRQLAQFHLQDVVKHLHAIPGDALLSAVLLTAASYLSLSAYDVLALRYLGKHIPFNRVLLVTFIANVIGYNVGFAALTGAAFRLRLYAASKLTATDVATIAAFSTATMALGLATLAGLSFLMEPSQAATAIHAHRGWSIALGATLLGVVLAFFIWSSMKNRHIEIGGWLLRPPGALSGGALIVVGTVDFALSAGVLYCLLPADAQIGFITFIGAYAIAVAAGVISHVPAGLGVFEATILLALPEVRADALLGSMLGYRVIYYLGPLIIAAALFGLKEVAAQQAILKAAHDRAAAFIAPLVPSIVGALTFVAGFVLLLSGATPAIDTRLEPLERLLPLTIVELSHLAGSIIGLALIVLARALFMRVKAAYHIAFWLLVGGCLASLLKGFDYEEAALLSIVLVVLALGRRAFYRPTSIWDEPFTPTWVVSIVGVILASIWTGFLAYRHVEYSRELWWTFAFDANAPRMLRASLLVGILGAAYLLLNLMRPARPEPGEASLQDLQKARKAIEQSSNTLANAALTGDKHLLFNDRSDAFIMYQVQGRSWIALGDPVGPRREAEELVWRFRELSDQHGGRTVFYQASAECLSLYVDLGLAAMKIGEEARVPLDSFSLEGSARAELRQAHRRAGRDAASFEIVPAEKVPDLLPVLAQISDAWLADKATAEKRFSVGAFTPEYMRQFPVAVVRREGEPVAFANLWVTGTREELSIDLMRFGPDAPRGAMDYLFIELMLWGRAQGYRWFNLGMAPLAGLEGHPLAPAWHRIGNFVFRHGEHFYNFDGLRRYKAKFDPEWEPKYLMAPGGVALPLILVDVSVLIAGGLRELFAK